MIFCVHIESKYLIMKIWRIMIRIQIGGKFFLHLLVLLTFLRFLDIRVVQCLKDVDASTIFMFFILLGILNDMTYEV